MTRNSSSKGAPRGELSNGGKVETARQLSILGARETYVARSAISRRAADQSFVLVGTALRVHDGGPPYAGEGSSAWLSGCEVEIELCLGA